jgi:hypothetical protein
VSVRISDRVSLDCGGARERAASLAVDPMAHATVGVDDVAVALHQRL